jgi:hypothetical protein
MKGLEKKTVGPSEVHVGKTDKGGDFQKLSVLGFQNFPYVFFAVGGHV